MATMQTPEGTLLKKGSRGDAVREVQMKLHRLGFDLAADGIFGDATEKAVIQLQAMFGYTVDGIVGEGTMRLVDAQIDHHWNVQLPNAHELALRAQGAHEPDAEAAPAARTHAPDLAGSRITPGASKPAGAPGSTPSSTLPRTPPQGSPLKR